MLLTSPSFLYEHDGDNKASDLHTIGRELSATGELRAHLKRGRASSKEPNRRTRKCTTLGYFQAILESL
jgi:hypothetical protein